MLQIVESTNENLSVLTHGDRVFHDALALVKKGEKRFHVSRSGGEDYDLQYVGNMDLFPEQVKSAVMTMTGGKDLFPLFLDYDESQTERICLRFLDQFNRAEFECLDEYTITVARVILENTDLPVWFNDERIYWFLPKSERLCVTDSFCETKPKETLRVIAAPTELGVTKADWSFIGSVVAFQNLFFWQVIPEGKTIKYLEVICQNDAGIGAVLAHITTVSRAVAEKGWGAYMSPGSTRYPDDLMKRYFRLGAKPADAVPDNTAVLTNYTYFSITWYFNQFTPDFDESILDDKLAADINEYADAILKGKRTLGVLARGTDYTILNMGDERIQANAAQMIPVIRKWMDEGHYDRIFLATEDEDIFRAIRKAFPGRMIAIAQERHTTSELEASGCNLLDELEKKIYTAEEYRASLEDTTVNYFYALYILSKCDAFLCSGRCNGYDVVKTFNHGRFEKEYRFTVGITGDPGTEDWKQLRPLFAGIFARGTYPERKAFFITQAFTLDDPVSPEAVRSAWEKTMEVYPYFTRAVVKRNRTYYLAENPLDFVIRDSENIIEPGTGEGNYHSVTICYHDRNITFYTDHVVTDGTACREVLQTFFYYYFCAADGTVYPVPEGVRKIEDGVPADQETDAYLMVPAIDPAKAQEAMGAQAQTDVFEYPEIAQTKSALTEEDCGRYLIRVPSQELMAYARSVDGTPSTILFQLIGQSFQRLNADNRLPYRMIMPVSVREVMGNPNSLLHQVVHNSYVCDPEMLSGDDRAKEFNDAFRAQLAQFSENENIHMVCGLYRGIIEGYQKAINANMLDRAGAGTPAMKISVMATHLGTLSTGSYGSRIHLKAQNVMARRGYMVTMLEVGGEFYICFNAGTKTDRYVRDMTEHMQELGMSNAVWETV